jgi:hypothetical protein
MSTPAAVQKTAVVPPPRPSRMTIANVTRGKVVGPARIIVYGVDGVGKSTFAAAAPNPIFLGAEDGTRHLDVARYPVPQTWAEVLEAVRNLTADAGGFKTFVIDTIDWTEPLLLAELCRREGVANRDEIGGGYQKWIDAEVDEWRVLLAALERLQAAQKMNVVLLAHYIKKSVKNPDTEDYERFQLKLHDKHAGVLREWVEGVYFARHEQYADKDKKTKRVRGVSTGARLLFTRWTAAWDAKDRYNLPEQIPLDWNEFENARASADVATEALKAEIERKAKELGGEIEKFARDYLVKNATNAVQLNLLNTKLNAKLAEKAEQAAPAPAAANQ